MAFVGHIRGMPPILALVSMCYYSTCKKDGPAKQTSLIYERVVTTDFPEGNCKLERGCREVYKNLKSLEETDERIRVKQIRRLEQEEQIANTA